MFIMELINIHRKKELNVDKHLYLQRIRIDEQRPTLSYLQQLQYKHLFYVPFENLDVIRKVPIYLNLKRIYEKVVTNHRGGYCYEVNGLFQWLLNELGFDTYLVGATVMRPTGEFAKKNTHVGIIANLKKPYLVDVGFGHSQFQPISLDGQIFTDQNGSYKVQQLNENTYDLVRLHDDEWRILYRFELIKLNLSDFHEGIVYNQVSPKSSFTQADLVTKPTKTGRLVLRDHTLTTIVDGQRTERQLSSIEKHEVLKNKFGILLDE